MIFSFDRPTETLQACAHSIFDNFYDIVAVMR